MKKIIFLTLLLILTSSGVNAQDRNKGGSSTDSGITFTDITNNNASTVKHGFVPKLSGNAGDALKGDGTWGAVSGGGGTNLPDGIQLTNPVVTGDLHVGPHVIHDGSGDLTAIVPPGGGFTLHNNLGDIFHVSGAGSITVSGGIYSSTSLHLDGGSILTDGGGNLTVSGLSITSLPTNSFVGTQPNGTSLVTIAPVTGLVSQNGTTTLTARTITAGSSKISVSNGSGATANPTIDLGTVTIANLSDGTNVATLNGSQTVTGSPTFSGNPVFGTITSATNPGVVTIINFPIATGSAGTVQEGVIQMGGITVGKFHGELDGAGSVTNVCWMFRGTTGNGVAPAGYQGEFITASLPAGSALSLTTGTVLSITNISLTAGYWKITGQADYTAAGTTVITSMLQGGSTIAATLGAADTYSTTIYSTTTAVDPGNPIPSQYISLATTTTVYLVAKANFSVSTLTGYGTISALRVR